MITIENEYLSVTISEEKGGTLQSIRTVADGREYLWQGDKAYWGGRAPNLFPFVGRLYRETYTLHGKPYHMRTHGFLNHEALRVEKAEPDAVSLALEDSPALREVYPFPFYLTLSYRLDGKALKIRLQVENRGEEILYFGMGGHPGFNLPLEEGLAFEDYELVFPKACAPRLVEFDPGVLCTGERTPYPLLDGRRLPLRHSLFTFDAIVLADAPRSVTLASPKGSHGVTVAYPQMPYVGFWHKPQTDAPFVCIEPWSVLPGRSGTIEELSEMEDMTAVQPGTAAANEWSISVW